MSVNEKEEYLKFMIIITLRHNIDQCKTNLEYRKEKLKNDPNNYTSNYKYNETLDFYNGNIRIAKELFNLDITDDYSELNNEIWKMWPKILEYLKNKKCNYEWTRKDFENEKYYEIYNYVTSYDLYWEKKSSKTDTDPIYFEFMRIKYLDNKFANIFKEIINNGLFNPNKRTVNYSDEPFWAVNIPHDYNSTEISDKVIFDKRCNYRMMDNGTDNVLLLLRELTGFFGKVDMNDTKKTFALNFIYRIIKENNCSILQEYVDDSHDQPRFILAQPLIFLLFTDEKNLTMYDEFNSLYKYCITEEGVKNQCNALEHKTGGCSKAIDFYISLIEKDNPENKNGIQLLKKMM